MVSLLAQKLAKFHSIKMPIPKDNSKIWLKRICEYWFEDNLKQSLTNGKLFEIIRSQNIDTFMKFDFGAELLWIKKAILASNSPIVFSHCDFNRENILIRENSNNNNPEIFLIDFDLSSFNYRGIDIGRYFSSWGHEDPMFGFGEYPTDEQMSVFVCAYINENIKLLGNSYSELEINSKENIIKEAKLFTLMCYLIDVLFCLYMSATDESKLIEFLVSISSVVKTRIFQINRTNSEIYSYFSL
jgi:thiamine kinase-like enzyme